MNDRIPFEYGEFYDYPRMVEFSFSGQWYFLSSAFDEQTDDYPDYYEVYLLPFHSKEEIKAQPRYWTDLNRASHLGRIAIAEVGLDPTRRQSIDGRAFAAWLAGDKKLLAANPQSNA